MLAQNVLIIAAEDSSAIYATQFLSEWRKLPEGSSTRFWGIGGQQMKDLGFEALYTPKEMAVVGLVEVLKHYTRIRNILFEIRDQIRISKPDFVVLLDYPEFNLRLAKECKELGIPVIYWIPPQVWAWRKGRVKLIKKYVDTVITVFPFEQSFFKSHGIPCEYFGHPLVDSISLDYFTPEKREMRRLQVGINKGCTVIGLMPGSRRSEIDKTFDVMLEAAHQIYEKNKQCVFLLPVAPSIEVSDIQDRLSNSGIPLIIQKRPPQEVIDLMDLAIVASGTATLLVALLNKPMVIIYKMAPLTSWVLKRVVKGVSFFGLPNLILKRAVVPELFQEQVSSQAISGHILGWLDHPESVKEIQKSFSELRVELGSTEPVLQSIVGFCSQKFLKKM